MHISELELVTRVLVGWGLTFVLGFERAVRGAPAGDRTFSLVGAGTALIGALSLSSPSVLGGAVTGIGFIGGGLCFRQAAQDREILHGVTTAASIFCAAAIGAAAGVGHVWLAVIAAGAVFLSLEIRHLPVFRLLDARRWAPYFHHDDHAHFTLRGIEKAIEREVESEAEAVKQLTLAACGHPDEPHECTQTQVEQVRAVLLDAAPRGTARAAISDDVERAIEADVIADQMIEANAATSRGSAR
ncbi:MgtC/SapB family protein [Actinocrinis puniceicyclus]|uniref:MgtC/SapB family protein n=1 Tax=Actinocrinis puniceicyclus TaxID=977794 RepID=A0A8J7WQN7_9ACTN|nr:MgtC/SapB family protein [Actinocrinis puniceicyclus]MBS2964217.1 MgtC/SapB family protein [Actinocrinis puniceicyclus]